MIVLDDSVSKFFRLVVVPPLLYFATWFVYKNNHNYIYVFYPNPVQTHFMKRSQVNDGWIRCNRSKTESGAALEEEMTGAVIKTSDVRKNWAFVPKWIVSHSDVLEHVFEDEEEKVIEYPALNVEGVTKKSIEDCVLLYRLSKKLIGSFGNQDFKWRYYSKNNTMQKVLRTVYRWRTRLGYLISTAGFFGWRLVQNLGDAVMKFRVSSSYMVGLKNIIFATHGHEHKVDGLLDYFVGKLKYSKLHFEMISSWVDQTILNEWVWNIIFHSGDIFTVTESFDFMTKYLKFKPLFWNRVSFGWARQGSFMSLMTYGSERNFRNGCALLSKICDYTQLGHAISFYNDHFLFRIIWQLSDEIFTKIINNVIKYKTKFEIVPATTRSKYQRYFDELYNNDIVQTAVSPQPFILSRWVDFLWAMDAPEDTLGKILKYFPRHCKHAMEVFTFT